MTLVPRYDIPVGSEITLRGSQLALTEATEAGYSFLTLETGQKHFVSLRQFADYLKLPGTKIDGQLPETGNRLQERMGGFTTAKGLPQIQQDNGAFNLALCHAMQLLREKTRASTNNPTYDFSINKLNEPANRLFIKNVAETLFGQKIRIGPGTGGKHTSWNMPKGRTLLKHFRIFEGLHPDESPLDALITMDHLKGNRTPRICWRVRELMTQAWTEIGLDTKSPSVANAYRHFERLIFDENAIRVRNELPRLRLPAASTLAAHVRALQTPLEREIGTKGERHARNKHGRGSTDIRALLIGEYVEIDECKASLVTSAKERGLWEKLSEGDKEALIAVDVLIGQRLQILVMIDVATRMPLAWVVSDQPRHEATLALIRMATRDKTREQQKYGCTGTPAQAVGIGNIKMDNGAGLRNSMVIGALIGSDAKTIIARTHVGMEKPYVERMFGTVESVLLKISHGYTGRRPGELPGYDSTVNGVLDIDELYQIVTRFMIDEYPSTPHSGVGMGGRRPADVYEQINSTRGHILPLDPNQRRIHLGWETGATPTDEGVRVFSWIWYNSDQFQDELETWRGKKSDQSSVRVSVFVDPDDATRATVLLPGAKEPIEVHIQITAFADLSLPEIFELMAAMRKENPGVAEIHEDRIMRARRDRFEQLKAIGVEHNLPRSFSTLDECRRKASALLMGARIVPTSQLPGTVPAGSVTRLQDSPAVFQLGEANEVIDGTATETAPGENSSDPSELAPLSGMPEPPQEPISRKAASKSKKKRTTENKATNITLGRPQDLKGLE